MHRKVNIRNAKVELPKEADSTAFTPSSGTAARAAIQSRLGQSMETVSHSSKVPRKMPITRMADWVMPAGAGRNPKPRISSRETARIPYRALIVLVNGTTPLQCTESISTE